jgi:tripartite-type tricarboxylate transporter receptor subunit TctC
MKMTMQRRQFLCTAAVAAGGGLSLLATTARAQALPDTVKLFAGFAAGGTIDVTARRLADNLRDVVAKTVVVENRTGAGGQIALSALKASPADGLTLAVSPMSMLGIYPHTYKKLPYAPMTDFTPVSQIVRLDFGFAVGPLVPETVRSLTDFAAWCKANPRDANFGSPAAGSVPHFVGELFGRAAGVDLKHVPYRGSQPAIMDVIGGQLAAACGPVGEFMQHLPAGKVRLIATSGPSRSRFAPNAPTFVEQGFKDIVYDEWFGLFLPAKTPAEVVERLSVAVRKALSAPDLVAALAQMGLEAKGSTSAELAALLKKDTERWAPLIKTIGFTADA